MAWAAIRTARWRRSWPWASLAPHSSARRGRGLRSRSSSSTTRSRQPMLPSCAMRRGAGRAESRAPAAHAPILRVAARRRLADTPRTVLGACVVQAGEASWTHVGDSRLYLVRDGRILHRTRDHTVVQQLVESGRIREEAMYTHPERNRLLQCLGGYESPRPEAANRERLAEQDIVLLCSDGFWNPLTQRQLLHLLATRELEQAVADLVHLAEIRAGRGSDNISVVAMRWAGPGGGPAVREPERTIVQDLTATDVDYLRVSDEDIERAINELRAVLRKTSSS